MKQIQNADQIIKESFGRWISSLFSSIGSWNPGFSFDEQKAAFFTLIKLLLETGRIKFIAPGVDCYVSPRNPHPKYTIDDPEAHWHEPPEEIVTTLQAQWPQDAQNENDLQLTTYFYSIPGVIWVGDDGRHVAS